MGARAAKCQWCHAIVVFFRSPFTGGWRKFDARPVDGRTHTGRAAFPVENERAWKLPLLIEDLRVRRECGRDQAEDEAYDMPWHLPHDCPENPFSSGARSEGS